MNWYAKRKQRKKDIINEVKKDKLKKKKQKEIISKLNGDEKKEAKKNYKVEQKQLKKEEKARIASLTKSDKKTAKKNAKIYKKISHRPRRAIGWGIVLFLIMFIIVKVGPMVSDIASTISGKSDVITSGTKENKIALESGDRISEEIANEGITLLKNDGNSLPLQDKKVNVFGVSSFNFRYGGGGSGGSDTSRALSVYDGLEEAGISYNKELKDFYTNTMDIKEGSTDSTGVVEVIKSLVISKDSDEPSIDYLTEDVLTQAKNYSDNAMIILTSSGVESSDMSQEELKLSKNTKELIKKISEEFKQVTIVVNAGNPLELGCLEDFDNVKSILWVGTPGPYGTRSLGNVLSGNINPSGRLVDTYAYDVSSAPATENFGDYKYDNLDKHFVNYEEGIYIGYRFYETYYENDEESYTKAIQYPFGYGLSYSDFKWDVLKEDLNEDTITIEVQVTNIGDYSGKDVVQLYYSAPYYAGGIEKSAIELATYQKTKELSPGESEVVTLTYNTKDMSSYDMDKEEAYVLDEGNYDIKLAHNIHDIVTVSQYKQPEKLVIKEDSQTGTEIKNLFKNSANELTYLSRNNWDKTYPSDKDINYEAPDFVIEESNKKTVKSEGSTPKTGKNVNLKLEDLKGATYDDPKWDEFISQFTVDELMDYYTNGAYETIAIERLGVPATLLLDGPAGINFFFMPVEAASYPSEIVLSSTWNDQLAYDMGSAVGKEAKAMGVHGWYAPAMNIHRTPEGGRNFEYFSEDPVLSGKMASAITQGSQNEGVMVFMKHFAMNDQEKNARSGLYVWSNEQAMRELHLRPFEICVKEGKNIATMSSFSYINGQWAGANSVLLNDLLRDEWGFEGMVSSDAVFDFMHADNAVVSGNDLMLDIMSKTKNKKRLEKAYKVDPAGITSGLQTSAKNVMYSILQTYLFD